jgi:hypothetical protein
VALRPALWASLVVALEAPQVFAAEQGEVRLHAAALAAAMTSKQCCRMLVQVLAIISLKHPTNMLGGGQGSSRWLQCPQITGRAIFSAWFLLFLSELSSSS